MRPMKIKAAAEELGISETQCLALIHRKAIDAFNVATNPLGRPAWRIERSALNRFRESRGNSTPAPKCRQRRIPTEIREYI
jgi:hypothetical protein